MSDEERLTESMDEENSSESDPEMIVEDHVEVETMTAEQLSIRTRIFHEYEFNLYGNVRPDSRTHI